MEPLPEVQVLTTVMDQARQHSGDRAELHAAICAAVEALQTQGWSVQATLIEIKHAIHKEHAPLGPDPLGDYAVQACIKHFYRNA